MRGRVIAGASLGLIVILAGTLSMLAPASALGGGPAPTSVVEPTDLSDLANAEGLYHEAIERLEGGEYAAGEAAARRVLAIRERVLGPNDRGVAHAANMLGLLLRHQNRLVEAEAAHRRAIAIWEAAPGGPLPERGHAYTNL